MSLICDPRRPSSKVSRISECQAAEVHQPFVKRPSTDCSHPLSPSVPSPAVLFFWEGVRLPGEEGLRTIRVRPGGSGRYEQLRLSPGFLPIHFPSSHSFLGKDAFSHHPLSSAFLFTSSS